MPSRARLGAIREPLLATSLAIRVGRRYGRSAKTALTRWNCGAPGGIRTPNLLIRSQMLYPLSHGCRPHARAHERPPSVAARGLGELTRSHRGGLDTDLTQALDRQVDRSLRHGNGNPDCS